METEQRITEARSLGMQLHDAETAICIGRRAVVEIQMHEPVDAMALEVAKQGITSARQARNALRRQLETAKSIPMPKCKW